MLPVVFHPVAMDEAREAAAWYEDRRVGLGPRFESDVEKTKCTIQQNPLLFAADEFGDRIAPLEHFQHGIVFQIDPDRIWVASVTHLKRRPGHWRSRKPE